MEWFLHCFTLLVFLFLLILFSLRWAHSWIQSCSCLLYIYHGCPVVLRLFKFCTLIRDIRDLTKPRRRRQRVRQKNNRFNEQNNNSARFFCTFLCLHCTTTTWNDQILSLLGNGNGKAIKPTISVRTWARSPLFSYSQNPPLLSSRVNWDNREKV